MCETGVAIEERDEGLSEVTRLIGRAASAGLSLLCISSSLLHSTLKACVHAASVCVYVCVCTTAGYHLKLFIYCIQFKT